MSVSYKLYFSFRLERRKKLLQKRKEMAEKGELPEGADAVVEEKKLRFSLLPTTKF